VIGRVVPDVSKDYSAVVFRADQSKNGLLIVSGKTCILCLLCCVLAQLVRTLVAVIEAGACQGHDCASYLKVEARRTPQVPCVYRMCKKEGNI
jgi:hypothetical protein